MLTGTITTDGHGAGSARGTLDAIAPGFALIHGLDDHKKIELEFPMYDALYAWCEKKVAVN